MKKSLSIFLLLVMLLLCSGCSNAESQKLSLSVGEKSISIGDSTDSVLEILGDPENIYDSYNGVGIVWQYDNLEITQLNGEIIAIGITDTNPYSICGIRYGESKEAALEKLADIGHVSEMEGSASVTVEFDEAKGVAGAIEDQIEFNRSIPSMTEEELRKYGGIFILLDENDKVMLVNAYNQVCNFGF